MNKRGPKIRGACAARAPYFRYLFAFCVSPMILLNVSIKIIRISRILKLVVSTCLDTMTRLAASKKSPPKFLLSRTQLKSSTALVSNNKKPA